MSWFKVDDALPTHRKVLAIPRGARRLSAVGAWTMGGAWCAGNLTEGRIPKSVLDDLGIPPKTATDLVSAGLWLDELTHYRMHDYLVYNPTASEVQRDRAAAAERQRRAREKSRQARESRDGQGEEKEPPPAETDDRHAVTHGVTHGEVTRDVTGHGHGMSQRGVTPPPTRPGPSRPALVLDVDVEGPTSQPKDSCSPAAPSSALTLVGTGPSVEALFTQWWSVYPRKKAKQDALKAFRGALKTTSFHELMAGADRLRNQPGRDDEFTPYPASWLRAGQWADEPDAPSTALARPSTADAAVLQAAEAGARVLARRAQAGA